jgi:hypothetical protein
MSKYRPEGAFDVMGGGEYRMVSDRELSNFRRFMQSGIPLSEFGPQGAFDEKPARDCKERDEESSQSGSRLQALRDMANAVSRDGWGHLYDALRGLGKDDEEMEGERKDNGKGLEDLKPARQATLKFLRDDYPAKKIIVVVPPGREPSKHLRDLSRSTIKLTVDHLDECTLPLLVSKVGMRSVVRPHEYAPPANWVHPDDRLKKPKP